MESSIKGAAGDTYLKQSRTRIIMLILPDQQIIHRFSKIWRGLVGCSHKLSAISQWSERAGQLKISYHSFQTSMLPPTAAFGVYFHLHSKGPRGSEVTKCQMTRGRINFSVKVVIIQQLVRAISSNM